MLKYQHFAAEESLLASGGVLCPRPGCGAGIIIDIDETNVSSNDINCTRVVCSICGFVFCRRCLQGFHIGECLNEISIQSNENSKSQHQPGETDQSVRLIKEYTKPCPKCRTPTERSGGCMHIVCTRAQCGFNWCWICQTEWSRDCMGQHWFGE